MAAFYFTTISYEPHFKLTSHKRGHLPWVIVTGSKLPLRLRPVLNVTDRPKRMSHPPKQFLVDFCEIGAVNVTKVAKRQKKIRREFV